MSVPLDPVPCPLDHLAMRGRDDDVALVLRGETLSWKDLRSRVARLAAWLAAQVPQQGARVATWAAKGELTCLVPLAAAPLAMMKAARALSRSPLKTTRVLFFGLVARVEAGAPAGKLPVALAQLHRQTSCQ